MHLTLVESVRPGSAVIARPVYGATEQPIAESGTPLTAELIAELNRHGIDKIVVLDKETRDVRFDELMDSEYWIRLVHAIQQVYREAGSGVFAKEQLEEAVVMIADYLSAHGKVVPLPTGSVPRSMQLYAHVVNVAMWAAQTAANFGLEAEARRELIAGCLLHDIGKMISPANISEHPLAGYLMAKRHYGQGTSIPYIILQHQNIAGEAYRRSTADKPHADAAKLCYLCNLFDHLSDVSETMYFGALEVLLALPDRLFASRETNALTESVPKYLPGSTLRTPAGRTAVVVKLDDSSNAPLLRLTDTGQVVELDERQLASVEFVRL